MKIDRIKLLNIDKNTLEFIEKSCQRDGFYTFSSEDAHDERERIVSTSGSHNCGGRCVIKAHVKYNRIVRISTEDDIPDTEKVPQLRGCLRCRAYRNRIYNCDRLKYPMKRIGKRGEGKFKPITWQEALDITADNLKRIMHKYGPDSIYIQYATGNEGKLSEKAWMKRLLGMYGGYLSYYGNYSTACTQTATPYTFGTIYTGNSREDWVNSRLIILLGFNPADTIHGTNTAYYLKMARNAGAKIISIDPIYSNTAVALADKWIPVRPTTDNALMDAMAYVMIEENLQDQKFLDRYCVGFDESHMPSGIPGGNSYKNYILGKDGRKIPKTPAWAETITGIPRETIVELAREYALTKPAALIQGFGPQRHAYGEQVARGGTVLAAMTGNIGISGGWASGTGYPVENIYAASIPYYNPNKSEISMFSWPDAIVRGKGMGADLSVRGAKKLSSSIKLIFNLGGNCLVNQHTDSNGTAGILRDEDLVKFIVTNDQFFTASAKFSDIILPSDDMMEREDIVTPWDVGSYLLFMNKAVDTVFQCRNGYDWIGELAKRLGLFDRFTEGRSLNEWVEYLIEETAKKNPDFPSCSEFKKKGIYRRSYEKPSIAFKKQIEDPLHDPFPTPSGKIEIFSNRLWGMNNPEKIPAVPKYISAWEGPEDPISRKYPIQCIGHHSKRRVHSTFDNMGWMEEVERQQVFMNCEDARVRHISDGDMVKVFNSRGTVIIPVKVTARIMPGVASIPQGAWWTPDKNGADRRGCINVLTRYKPTPLAFGNPSHTSLVEIKKV